MCWRRDVRSICTRARSPPGACAQSRNLESALLVNLVDPHPTFDLQAPRSHAAYLWRLLAEARAEFGGRAR